MPRTRPKPSRSHLTPPPAAPKPKSYLDLPIYLGLILAVLAVYSQVGHFSFVTLDDPSYVTDNPHVRAGLTPASLLYAFTHVVDINWIPLTIVSHMAVCQFFGLESGAHHWVNVALHAFAAMLLFAALRRATRAPWPSAFVAFVFALHPLHVESVAWIAERKDVLSTLFWFAALYAYVRYTELPGIRRYLPVLALFALGLMSKPMLVTFPFTLLLLDVWPFRRTELPRTLWEKVPFLALSLASSVATYIIQSSAGASEGTNAGDSVRNALVSYVSYIGQTFWPAGLGAYYPLRGSIPAWQVAGAGAILLGLSAVAVLLWRTRPYIATGWFWYLGTLLPVIGLVQVGAQSHADRYMYVPMVGLSVIVAWGAAEVVRKWPLTKAGVASAAVVACLACLFTARAQAAYWRDSEALYRQAANVTKDNFLAEHALAEYLMQFPDRNAEAISHYREALRINPRSSNSHIVLGSYELQQGHDAEAIHHFEAALRIMPDLAAAHYNLGVVYAKSPDHLLDAVAHYEAALRSRPNFAAAHRNLGLLLLRLGRRTEAIAQLEAVQRIQYDPEVAGFLRALTVQPPEH